MESLEDILRRAQTVRRGDAGPATATGTCAIFGGAGDLRYDFAVDDPRFGELVACECTRRRQEERRLNRLLEKSNLGGLRDLTFESFHRKFSQGSPPRNSPDAAWIVAHRYATGEEPAAWLVLTGPFGTGKTHLAAAIANDRLARGQPAVFIVVPDLLDHLRSTFSPNSEVTYDDLFETVRDTPLLILDDLGTQTTTPWAQEKLYQILNHRYNKRLATIITTNLGPDELVRVDPRLYSRLGDPNISRVLEIRDIDKRLGYAHTVQGKQAGARKATP